MKTMSRFLSAAAICLAPLSASAQIEFFTDFEGEQGVSKDAWLAVVNYYSDTTCETYESTPYSFPAGDAGPQVSALVDADGSQKLNFFSNYDDAQQQTTCIETIILQEHTITDSDIGRYVFSFDTSLPTDPAQQGGDNTNAFVKLNFAPIAGTPVSPIPAGRKTVVVDITADMVGGLLQWGFANTSFDYQPTGIYYDNVRFGAPVVPQRPEGDANAVPFMPIWGLVGLAGLLGLLGWRQRR